MGTTIRYTFVILSTLTFIGCGNRDSSVNKAVPTAEVDQNAAVEEGAAVNTSCTEASCPPVNMGIAASGLSGEIGALVGMTGRNVEWVFEAIDQDNGGRTVGIFLLETPSGSESDTAGSISNKVQLNWTPTIAGRGTQPIVIVTRDMDRCRMEMQNPGDCDLSNINETYDVPTSMPYEIVDQNAIEQAQNEAIRQQGEVQQNCKQNQMIGVGSQVLGTVVPGASVISSILPMFMDNTGC
jgi:hypothetical protein